MNALSLINAVSRCFLTKPAHLPPVKYNGKNYELDVIYRGQRFFAADDDLVVVLNKYCAFITETDHKLEESRKEQEA